MPKKRSKPKELERIEIIEAAREESDDEAQQPHELPADAAHADFVKVWSAKMSDADGVLMRYPRAGKGAAHAEAVHAAYLKEYGLTAKEVPLVTVTPNPHCLFVANTRFESEGDPTRTCNAEHDHVSCGRCPYPG